MRKRFLGITLLSACCVLTSPLTTMANEEKVQHIGVASIFDDAGWQTQEQYFKEIIGPALDMDFVFSKKLSNEYDLVDFMEQAIALGCTGIINMVTQDSAVVAGAKLAEEKGVWYVTQNSMISEDVATLQHNLGHVGASAGGMENAYKQLVQELIDKEGRKAFFVYTGSAAGGNIGNGASSHFYSVKGMLEAIAESYGLEYQLPVEDLINSKESAYVETGREDVVIYLSATGDIGEGIADAREQFKKEDFDTFITVTSYSSFTGIIEEVEKKTNENIMIIATVSDDQMTQAGFATLDVTGDSILHAGVINPLSIANARCAELLSMGFRGNADEVKDDGHTRKYEVEPLICYDAEEYAQIDKEVKDGIQTIVME